MTYKRATTYIGITAWGFIYLIQILSHDMENAFTKVMGGINTENYFDIISIMKWLLAISPFIFIILALVLRDTGTNLLFELIRSGTKAKWSKRLLYKIIFSCLYYTLIGLLFGLISMDLLLILKIGLLFSLNLIFITIILVTVQMIWNPKVTLFFYILTVGLSSVLSCYGNFFKIYLIGSYGMYNQVKMSSDVQCISCISIQILIIVLVYLFSSKIIDRCLNKS